jgi:pyrimidine-nucleoside phosphorylase
MYALIRKKRDGGELTSDEIQQAISGYVSGAIPDYQMAALLMAIYFRGMTARETEDLTGAMVASGDSLDLSSLPGVTVDKHSTGGVGDKTTLVVGPLLAAAGLTVAKMSGRGLGHTGGTLDKLEAIPGFRTDISSGAMLDQLRQTGIAVVAQSSALVPADALLYALRDVTATVDSLPLIASSIMSKKLAAGAQAIILDVKTGSGAFMPTPVQAFALARALVDIGTAAGRAVRAIVTSMDQPLGMTVGNAVEVQEAIETLRGDGPADLRELCLVLAADLAQLASGSRDTRALRAQFENLLDSGAALAKFRDLVIAQGGDERVVDDPAAFLPVASCKREVLVPSAGYVAAIDALTVGDAARALGAGRERKGDAVDAAAGVRLVAKVGAHVDAHMPWAIAYASDEAHLEVGCSRLERALTMAPVAQREVPLILGTVDPDGTETRRSDVHAGCGL